MSRGKRNKVKGLKSEDPAEVGAVDTKMSKLTDVTDGKSFWWEPFNSSPGNRKMGISRGLTSDRCHEVGATKVTHSIDTTYTFSGFSTPLASLRPRRLTCQTVKMGALMVSHVSDVVEVRAASGKCLNYRGRTHKSVNVSSASHISLATHSEIIF